MSYLTRFDLSVYSEVSGINDYEKLICDFIGIKYLFTEKVKWYDYDLDVKAFSKLYPNVLFVLFGECERNEDMWMLYVENGKSVEYKTEISYPQFNRDDMV